MLTVFFLFPSSPLFLSSPIFLPISALPSLSPMSPSVGCHNAWSLGCKPPHHQNNNHTAHRSNHSMWGPKGNIFTLLSFKLHFRINLFVRSF